MIYIISFRANGAKRCMRSGERCIGFLVFIPRLSGAGGALLTQFCMLAKMAGELCLLNGCRKATEARKTVTLRASMVFAYAKNAP